MPTYVTLEGQVLTLTGLTGSEASFFDRCYAAYRSGMDWAEFDNTFVSGLENPLLRDTKGWVTPQVWNHALFRAIQDLADRLGIKQGALAAEGHPEIDPLIQEPTAAQR